MTGPPSTWRRRRRTPAVISCRELGRVLQSYLDGEQDDLTARRVTRHLDTCLRCGMDADTYRCIKRSLARHRALLPDLDAVTRLRAFALQLVDESAIHDRQDVPPTSW